MSDLESSFKNLIPYLNQQAIKALMDCSQSAGKENISIPACSFPQLIDAAYMTTDYKKTSLYISQIEQEALNDLLKKTFNYMNERATRNNVEDVKSLTREIILLASNLHATIIANENDKPKEASTNEQV